MTTRVGAYRICVRNHLEAALLSARRVPARPGDFRGGLRRRPRRGRTLWRGLELRLGGAFSSPADMRTGVNGVCGGSDGGGGVALSTDDPRGRRGRRRPVTC